MIISESSDTFVIAKSESSGDVRNSAVDWGCSGDDGCCSDEACCSYDYSADIPALP